MLLMTSGCRADPDSFKDEARRFPVRFRRYLPRSDFFLVVTENVGTLGKSSTHRHLSPAGWTIHNLSSFLATLSIV